jgi:hypothetical protein
MPALLLGSPADGDAGRLRRSRPRGTVRTGRSRRAHLRPAPGDRPHTHRPGRRLRHVCRPTAGLPQRVAARHRRRPRTAAPSPRRSRRSSSWRTTRTPADSGTNSAGPRTRVSGGARPTTTAVLAMHCPVPARAGGRRTRRQHHRTTDRGPPHLLGEPAGPGHAPRLRLPHPGAVGARQRGLRCRLPLPGRSGHPRATAAAHAACPVAPAGLHRGRRPFRPPLRSGLACRGGQKDRHPVDLAAPGHADGCRRGDRHAGLRGP